ncbi:MAG TPA: ParA family protein [Trichocoleus sp.]
MIITILSHKGGAGKTVTAIHLAAYLGKQSPTLLVDSDPNGSALRWAARAEKELPFKTFSQEGLAGYFMKGGTPPTHMVLDTEARPTLDQLRSHASQSDFLLIPTTPSILSSDTLPLLLQDIGKLASQGDRICPFAFLLTIVPPRPSKAGEEAQAFLKERGLPILNQRIRRYNAFEIAALKGCPVYDVKGDENAGIAWSDYTQAFKEMEEMING